MNSFFNVDGPVMSFLSRIADLVWLNILFLVCSIPIFTIGASTTAMYYVALKLVKGEEGYITKDFFRSFKQNFKQATIIWLLVSLFVIIFAVDIIFVVKTGFAYSHIVIAVILIPTLMLCFTTLYVFPVLARFDNTVMNTIKNSFFMSIAHAPRTVFMLIFTVIPLLFIMSSLAWLPLLILGAFSLVAFSNASWFDKIFKKYEPEEVGVESTDEGIFEGSDSLEKGENGVS